MVLPAKLAALLVLCVLFKGGDGLAFWRPLRNANRGRCRAPSLDESFTIVTSAGGRHFHDVTNVLVESIRTLNVTGELLLYHENSFSARRGEALVDSKRVDGLNTGDTCFKIRMFDLFLELPWIEEFAHGKSTVFQSMQHKTNGTYWMKWNVKAHLIFRKAAAIFHAITKVATTRFLIWLDTDVLFLKDLDAQFFRFARAYDVSYIWRILNQPKGDHYVGGHMHAETGIVVYKVNSVTQALLSIMMEYYKDPPDFEECLDDTCVFSNVVSRMVKDGNLRDGHFATCADRIGSDTTQGKRNRIEGRPWEQMIGKYYKGGPRTYACNDAIKFTNLRSNVSQFNLFEYLIHLKGNKRYFQAMKKELRRAKYRPREV